MNTQALTAIGLVIIFALYVYMLFPLPSRPFPRHVRAASNTVAVIGICLVVLTLLSQPAGEQSTKGLTTVGTLLIVLGGFFGSISAFLFWKKRHLTRTERVVLVLAWSALTVFARSRQGA